MRNLIIINVINVLVTMEITYTKTVPNVLHNVYFVMVHSLTIVLNVMVYSNLVHKVVINVI